ncbi:MAG: alpha-xylosidase [Oscillospiraceae bacterium]|nr:alpha-xylosidase [Oscillospiraceae bacterium]
MKFSNGYWLYKEGVTASGCAEVRNIKISQTEAILYIAPSKVYNRGQTLGGPLFTLTFSSPQSGIINVNFKHYENESGNYENLPAYVYNNRNCPLETKNQDGVIIISSGDLNVEISKDPFKIVYKYKDKYLTSSNEKQLAYMKTPDGNYMRERLGVSAGENIYGLGERFTPYIKNGQSVDIWNEDGGTASEQAYKNIPFYLSNRGYGIYVNHPELVSFEICSEAASKSQFSVKGEELNYCVIGGEDLSRVVSRYTALTGRPSLPPAWSFGLWLSTSFTTQYDEQTVTSFIDGMKERDIPLSVFHFDCFWMREYEWCNFDWDKEKFPDPENMLARLKAKGLKICVWINPYISHISPLFEEARQNGYLIKNKTGGVWQWDLWQPGMGIVDFTNPAAAEWYKDKLRKLMDGGVDCFKTDFGERIPVDCVYFDGSDPLLMHNYYAYIYNKAVFEVTQEKKGASEGIVFARSASPGSQSFPVHWGGDCEATYEAMAESLRGGLSLSLCGFGFWSHDISGFENTATPDLYKRWVAFGLFSSHSRLHGSGSYRVPWLFDEEAVEVLKFFTKQKCALMPYLFATAVKASETGIPVMRPMVLEFQDDPVCAFLDRQYMLGDNLLAAPVFNDRGETETYLPDGVWTHWFTNRQAEGGRYISEKNDYFNLPLWARPNSVIITGKDNSAVVYDYEDEPVLHVFRLDKANAVIFGKDGEKKLNVELEKDESENKISVSAGGNKKGFKLLFRNLKIHTRIRAVNGGGEIDLTSRQTELGFEIDIPAGCETLEIYF